MVNNISRDEAVHAMDIRYYLNGLRVKPEGDKDLKVMTINRK
jgi:hypothetical protein